MPAYDDEGFSPAAPVAIVILRHPDSGKSLADVPMLIDSGADATLLPRIRRRFARHHGYWRAV